jgi:trimeric autotransporter adhesin
LKIPGTGANVRYWFTPVTAAAAAALMAACALTAPTALAGSRAPGTARAAGLRARPAAATAGVISTFAGGVGGPAKGTNVATEPCAVAFGGGNLYATDIAKVRQVSLSAGWLTTVAGVGAGGPLGDGGPANKAAVGSSCGMAVDHSGNLVFSDGNRIRVVAASTGTFYGQAMTAGDIYAVAGNGTAGFTGDGGPATSAELNGPVGVAVDSSGNLIISDQDNDRIRVVAARTGTFYGKAMTADDIYTVAGGGSQGGLGGPATKAYIGAPPGVGVDPAGNLLIADGPTGVLAVAAHTGTFYGVAMTAGDIYLVAGGGSSGLGDGGPALGAEMWAFGVTTDAAGNLVIADSQNDRVRVVAAKTGTFYGQAMTADHIYTVAGGGFNGLGDGGPATSAVLDDPTGVAFDSAGNLLIADNVDNRVRVVAGSTGTFYGMAMTAGDIYTVAGNGYRAYSGDGGPATKAQLSLPGAVAVDASGNVLIADTSNNRVRVVAGSTGTFYGKAMTAGVTYTVAGDGTAGAAGNGGPATEAELNGPTGVAADASGNLLIADYYNNKIRAVAAKTGTFYGEAMTAGHLYTVAGGGTESGNGIPATKASLRYPSGVAADAAGNLLIADSLNGEVYVVAAKTGTFYGQAMTAGDIYTLAGGGKEIESGIPATKASLKPQAVAVDAAGNVLIAAGDIFVVAAHTGTFYGMAMTAGDIYIVAGGGSHGLGDGGPATSAELGNPLGVAVDKAGNLLIADTGNERLRVVAESTGTFYGQAMTAGDIYTVAGDGNAGFFGDGGAGTSAWLDGPSGVAADGTNLLIADTGTGRIREVTG